jgi:hypothetical protein
MRRSFCLASLAEGECSKGDGEQRDLLPDRSVFRLGDLASSVQRRAGPGESLATVVRRDLGRYYDVLGHTELPDFTVEEADALSILLSNYSEDVLILSTVVAESLEAMQRRLEDVGAHDVLRPRVPDHKQFIDKVEGMTRTQQLATLDAVERYWVAWQQEGKKLLPSRPSDPHPWARPLHETEVALLQEVSLTHPIYANRYLKEHGMLAPLEPGRRKVLGEPGKRRSRQ